MNKPLIAGVISLAVGFLFGYTLPFALFMGFLGYLSTNIPFDEISGKMYMFFERIIPGVPANFCIVIATLMFFILVPDIFDWPVFLAYLVVKFLN